MSTLTSLKTRAIALRRASDSSQLRLGKILLAIREKSGSFHKDCSDIGVDYRKAMFLIQIHIVMVARKVVPFSRLTALGWGKLAMLTSVCKDTTPVETVQKWICRAEKTSMAVLRKQLNGVDPETLAVQFYVSAREKRRLMRTLKEYGMTVVKGQCKDRDLAFSRMVLAASSAKH